MLERLIGQRAWRITILVGFVAVELGAARLAYYTLGEVPSAIYYIYGVVIGNAAVALALWAGYRKAGMLAATVLFSAVVIPQLALGWQLVELRHEAERVVTLLEQVEARSGHYPASLSGYELKDRSLAPHFSYRRSDEHGGFYLSYYVGNRGVSYSYSPRHGWGYYPD